MTEKFNIVVDQVNHPTHYTSDPSGEVEQAFSPAELSEAYPDRLPK